MGVIGNYFKNEFQVRMLTLEHESVSDFYLSCWQNNRSSFPLLCLRTILFIGCSAILITSMILMSALSNFGLWFIYLTHWGLLLITITTALGFGVSVRACLNRPILLNEATFGLPWYIKLYWISYNTTIPTAFLITVFYWGLLANSEFMESEGTQVLNKTLDIFIHGINSVLMFVLLIISKHPSRLLHIYQPLTLSIIYLIFSVIFYSAEGTDPFGNPWIYPMLDWSDPGPTMLMVVLTAVLLAVLHVVVVIIALIRNSLTRHYRRNSDSLPISS